jgi:hypothetical protein
MIVTLKSKATDAQLTRMAAAHEGFIKVAVDITQGILAGGGEWHKDAADQLKAEGSRDENIWGAGYDLATGQVTFDSQINIRRDGSNTTREIASEDIRRQVELIVRALLEL